MRARTFAVLVLAVAASCSTQHEVVRATQVPLLPGEMPRADLERDAGKRAAADLSPPLPSSAFAGPVALPEAAPGWRSLVESAETPAYEPMPPSGRAAAPYPVYVDWYDAVPRGRSHWREPVFPVNTVVGAGIGAVIGHQSHHRNRGALIGGSVGLLFDLARWSR